MTKQEAREKMKILRRELSGAEREKKDHAIAQRLFAFPAMQQAVCFFPFVSYGTEVDTRNIIKRVLAEGRLKIAVPKVQGTEMEFHPGLAFDREKNRVGYGGGYYDRYLERYGSRNLVTIALAYEFQIVDRIEAEEFDRRPQWLITENGIF